MNFPNELAITFLGIFPREMRIYFYAEICTRRIFFFFFLGPHLQHMEVTRLGLNQSCSCWPTPQPRRMSTSVTYTTAHGNPRSLTH